MKIRIKRRKYEKVFYLKMRPREVDCDGGLWVGCLCMAGYPNSKGGRDFYKSRITAVKNIGQGTRAKTVYTVYCLEDKSTFKTDWVMSMPPVKGEYHPYDIRSYEAMKARQTGRPTPHCGDTVRTSVYTMFPETAHDLVKKYSTSQILGDVSNPLH